MRLKFGLFILIVLSACSTGNKNISVSAIKFNGQFCSNPIGVDKPYFDTLQNTINNNKPDLVFFKEIKFTEECETIIKNEGYQFIPFYVIEDDSSFLLTPIVIKTKAIDLLGRSYHTFNIDSLSGDRNVVEWFKLKNKRSGHVFYVFSIQLKPNISSIQSKYIAFDLLQIIDQISAGLPVIVIGDFNNKNDKVKEILIQEWLDIYPLKEIRSDIKSDFLVNDFFKVKHSFSDEKGDSLVNNMVIKFLINSDKITRSKKGKPIPNLN